MVKSHRPLKRNFSLAIAIVAVAIAIICLLVLVFGLFQTVDNQNNEEVNENMMSQKLPKEVVDKLDLIRERNSFSVTRWEIDEQRKNIVLYEVYMDEDQINELQGEKIDGWTISVLKDIEYINEREAARAELMELENNPELQIGGFEMTYFKEVNIWVYSLTPENQALDGKVIHGWTIHVYVSLTPTPTAARK